VGPRFVTAVERFRANAIEAFLPHPPGLRASSPLDQNGAARGSARGDLGSHRAHGTVRLCYASFESLLVGNSPLMFLIFEYLPWVDPPLLKLVSPAARTSVDLPASPPWHLSSTDVHSLGGAEPVEGPQVRTCLFIRKWPARFRSSAGKLNS